MFHFPGEARPRTAVEDERALAESQEIGRMDKLCKFSPSAYALVRAFKEGTSAAEILEEMHAYNHPDPEVARAEGSCQEFTVVSRSRQAMAVRMYDNGRVTLSLEAEEARKAA